MKYTFLDGICHNADLWYIRAGVCCQKSLDSCIMAGGSEGILYLIYRSDTLLFCRIGIQVWFYWPSLYY